jgi:hypothetical protein
MFNAYSAAVILIGFVSLGALIRSTTNTVLQKPVVGAATVTDAPIKQPEFIGKYGPLSQTYVDAQHGFSIRYPEIFLAKEFSEWSAIVDNDTKAAAWLGLCPPNCARLPGSPFSRLEKDYTQDHTVTWRDLPEIPHGEGRRLHILSGREFTTAHGTRAIEQFYEVTGFEVTTGNSVMVHCGEDTPCEVAGPSLRYIFFSEGKAPYVISVRTLSPHDRHLAVIQAIVETALY